MKRYLVTGGTGFIGTSIVQRLAEGNHYVRVLDNEFRSSSQLPTHVKNVEYIKGDIRILHDVENASIDIDSIIHLAYINGTKYFYEKPDLVLDVAVKGMINVLDSAKKNNITELFLASSSEVYQTPPIIPTPEEVPLIIPDPINPRYSYGGGKIISELLSLHVGRKIFKKVVIFRPHNVYGPNMGREHVIPELIIKMLKAQTGKDKSIHIQGDGSTTRAFVYIDDFVDGLMILLNKGANGQIYNIGTENEVSVLELIKILGKISDIKPSLVYNSQPTGGTQRRCPDTSKLKKLGYKPTVTLEQGLKNTYTWYFNNMHKLQSNEKN